MPGSHKSFYLKNSFSTINRFRLLINKTFFSNSSINVAVGSIYQTILIKSAQQDSAIDSYSKNIKQFVDLFGLKTGLLIFNEVIRFNNSRLVLTKAYNSNKLTLNCNFSDGLYILYKSYILTEENCQSLLDSGYNLPGLILILQMLQRSNKINIFQELFEALVINSEYTARIIRGLNNLALNYRFLQTRENLLLIIRAGDNANNQALEIIEQNNKRQEVKSVLPVHDKQSTHRTSVHDSVSKSADRLLIRYADKVTDKDIDKIISDIEGWAKRLPQNINLILNSIKRLTDPKLKFVDFKSQISTKQLLALAWLAIHDNNLRIRVIKDNETLIDKKQSLQESLKSALLMFYEGLYEIESEYNGRHCCAGGAFNKIIEKLVSVHPDVELLVITKEQASAKLPIIVREEIVNYISEVNTKLKTPDVSKYLNKMIKLKQEGVSAIWDDIEQAVTDSLFDEYKSIFFYKSNSEFKNIVSCGKEVDINKDTIVKVDQLIGNLTVTQPIEQLLGFNSKLQSRPQASDLQQTTDMAPSLRLN